MTRRQFLAIAPAAFVTAAPARDHAPLTVPVHRILDNEPKWKPRQIARSESLWSQALGDLSRGGIQLDVTRGEGGVWRPYYREPVISGLRRDALNVVITDMVPTVWSGGRALCGVTAQYRGHHLCMIAMNHAHGHQVPFFAINTCLHELLHALLLDIFDVPPGGILGQVREFRVDFHATRLWLFGDGASIRAGAHTYVERLRKSQAASLPSEARCCQ